MMSLRSVLRLAIAISISMVLENRDASAIDFAHDVMPILKQHCAECHTGARREGGLAMNHREQLLSGGESGDAVVIGNANESELLSRIISDDEGLRMPPDGPRVPSEEVAILRKWIESGLPWDAGITLGDSAWEPPLAPRQVPLPAAIDGRDHPIDRLLDHDLAERKMVPPVVSDALFFRRASLDAVGLLPTPEALERFEQDTSVDKREKLIDRLLSDDVAYADHWLTMWNDLLRNDYTGTGFITGGRKQITTWLYDSLRGNKPYDQMVRELISPSDVSAGFIDGIQWRGETNASQTREIQFAQNISQVFLGINMKCASCHDSFIDRWKLSEAYGLAAIYSDHSLEIHRCDKPTGETATARWIFPELGDVDPNASKARRLKQLAGLMTHPGNGRFTRTVVNRVWHRLIGRGIVHPVDAMHTRPWNEDLLDYLAVRFADDGYDLRRLIGWVMKSQAYQSRTVILESEPGEDYEYRGPMGKRMTAEQFLDCVWQITQTNPESPAVDVDRAPRSKGNRTGREVSRTAEKVRPVSAKWIWHREGPVPSIRLRKRFQLGEKPTHAKLMATCDNAFVMRINGEQVARSKNWQKPLYLNVAEFLREGENLIEVDAEMFGGACGFICQIDAAGAPSLATDGSWQSKHGDDPWVDAREVHVFGKGPWGAILDPKAEASSSTSLSPPVRAALVQNDFLMRSLGRPHRDQVVTTRPSELTTLQAIDLANGEILSDYLRRGAAKLHGRYADNRELVNWLFRFALSRSPTAGELSVLSDLLGDAPDPQAVEDVLWTVLMLPEFQIIR